jgi:hypothetical protein
MRANAGAWGLRSRATCGSSAPPHAERLQIREASLWRGGSFVQRHVAYEEARRFATPIAPGLAFHSYRNPHISETQIKGQCWRERFHDEAPDVNGFALASGAAQRL